MSNTGFEIGGDIVEVPLPTDFPSEVTPFLGVNGDEESSTARAPLGKWKDSLFACTRLGYFHPSLCNAILCPQLLMAQVLTRLRMNYWGQENVPDAEWRRTYRRVLLIVSIYWGFSGLFCPPPPLLLSDPATGNVLVAPPMQQQPPLHQFLYRLVFWSFVIYSTVVLARLRRAVRRQSEISPFRVLAFWGIGTSLEDLCLSFWCGCCTVAQVARQTCDYEREGATCCSNNGLLFGSRSNHSAIIV